MNYIKNCGFLIAMLVYWRVYTVCIYIYVYIYNRCAWCWDEHHQFLYHATWPLRILFGTVQTRKITWYSIKNPIPRTYCSSEWFLVVYVHMVCLLKMVICHGKLPNDQRVYPLVSHHIPLYPMTGHSNPRKDHRIPRIVEIVHLFRIFLGEYYINNPNMFGYMVGYTYIYIYIQHRHPWSYILL